MIKDSHLHNKVCSCDTTLQSTHCHVTDLQMHTLDQRCHLETAHVGMFSRLFSTDLQSSPISEHMFFKTFLDQSYLGCQQLQVWVWATGHCSCHLFSFLVTSLQLNNASDSDSISMQNMTHTYRLTQMALCCKQKKQSFPFTESKKDAAVRTIWLI